MHPTVFAILAKFGRSYKFGIVHFFLNWGMYVSVSFSTRGCIAAIWPIASRRSTTYSNRGGGTHGSELSAGGPGGQAWWLPSRSSDKDTVFLQYGLACGAAAWAGMIALPPFCGHGQ